MKLIPTSLSRSGGTFLAICYISLHSLATVPAAAQTVIATVNMNLDLSPYNFAGIAINPVTNRVYVAGNNNQFGRRLVDIGESQNGQTQILKGLSAGERVAANGSLFLQFANSFQH